MRDRDPLPGTDRPLWGLPDFLRLGGDFFRLNPKSRKNVLAFPLRKIEWPVFKIWDEPVLTDRFRRLCVTEWLKHRQHAVPFCDNVGDRNVPMVFNGLKLAPQRSHLGCQLSIIQTFGGITDHRVVQLRSIDLKEVLVSISFIEPPFLPTLVAQCPMGGALDISGVLTEGSYPGCLPGGSIVTGTAKSCPE
jgi:hypothetical protein